MATEPTIAVLNGARGAQETRAAALYATVSDYWALTKPDVNFLILITTFAGFYLASASDPAKFRYLLALHTLLGTLLVAGGTATLNQALEASFDSQMRRTSRRPVAAGRIRPSHAFGFGVSLALLGAAYLAFAVNALTCLLAVVTLATYLFLYTPLKRVTPFCVLVGAFPGAMPPLIGWAAARGRLDPEAWVLYAIVFLWQFPHFMAIAWMYREDYARAGYMVLPAGETRNRFVVWQSFAVSLALVPLSLFPMIVSGSGLFYSIGALVLSLIFFCYSARFAFRRSSIAARQLLAASIIYLPAVFMLLMLSGK
ncbi:MAG: heme o synthase [Candidatus Acidiferrales bacterium]